MSIKKRIEENQKQLDIMKYLLDTDQHDYISILTKDDYLKIDSLIRKGMGKDLAIRHVAIMREYKSLNINHRLEKILRYKAVLLERERQLNIRPKMEVSQGGNARSENTFDLRTLNDYLITNR